MSVTVKLPTILRKHAAGEAKVGADGATLRDVLSDLEGHYPGITKNVLAEDGGLHRFINVYVNDEDVRYLGSLETPVNEGDTVTITLNNQLNNLNAHNVRTSIMFPGQSNVLANGSPAQPQFDNTGKLISLTNFAEPGASITYSFVAGKPGTFIYESGTDYELQTQKIGRAHV